MYVDVGKTSCSTFRNDDTADMPTVSTGDINEHCTSNRGIFAVNKKIPKTTTERTREYRARKKTSAQERVKHDVLESSVCANSNELVFLIDKKIAKTSQERTREWRARKKQSSSSDTEKLPTKKVPMSTNDINDPGPCNRTSVLRINQIILNNTAEKVGECRSKSSSSDDTAKMLTVSTGDTNEACTSDQRVFVVNEIIPKTTVEQVPEDRAGKQQSAEKRVEKIPKTAAERAREYRARKRKEQNNDSEPSSKDNVLESSMCANSNECEFSIDKMIDEKIPKTSTETLPTKEVPMSTRDINDSGPCNRSSVLRINQIIPNNTAEEVGVCRSKSSSNEDTAKMLTASTGDSNQPCTSDQRVFAVNRRIPKTTAQRVRECRARKRLKIIPKTDAERAREYRARKRKKQSTNPGSSSKDDVPESSMYANSYECIFLTDKRIPKTSQERTREWRARKKQKSSSDIEKLPTKIVPISTSEINDPGPCNRGSVLQINEIIPNNTTEKVGECLSNSSSSDDTAKMLTVSTGDSNQPCTSDQHVFAVNKRIPKTTVERVREHRARKRKKQRSSSDIEKLPTKTGPISTSEINNPGPCNRGSVLQINEIIPNNTMEKVGEYPSKSSSSDDTAKMLTVSTGDSNQPCTSDQRVFAVNKRIPKTTVERVREHRARKRKKQRSSSDTEKLPTNKVPMSTSNINDPGSCNRRSVLRINEINPNNTPEKVGECHSKSSSSDDTAKMLVSSGDTNEPCTSDQRVFAVNKRIPKTTAERVRAYRERKRQRAQNQQHAQKQQRAQKHKKIPKTVAERVREYRARKRKKINGPGPSSKDDVLESSMCAKSNECEFLIYKMIDAKIPKTSTEQTRVCCVLKRQSSLSGTEKLPTNKVPMSTSDIKDPGSCNRRSVLWINKMNPSNTAEKVGECRVTIVVHKNLTLAQVTATGETTSMDNALPPMNKRSENDYEPSTSHCTMTNNTPTHITHELIIKGNKLICS